MQQEMNDSSGGTSTEKQLLQGFDKFYDKVFAQILELQLIMGGTNLGEAVETLIELNQQLTLDLNEAELDTSEGVALEEVFVQAADSLEEIQENNGFLSEKDIEEIRESVVKSLPKLALLQKKVD